MKVLYLTYDGLTDPLGQSQVLPYLEGLAGQGVSITIVSCEKPDRMQSLENNVRQSCEKNQISWVPVLYRKRMGLLSAFINILALIRKTDAVLKTRSFDLVHCRSYLPAWIGYRLKRKHLIPFIFDIRGFWIDERLEGNIWNAGNPLIRLLVAFLRIREKKTFPLADAIITLTHRSADRVRQHFLPPGHRENITVIPCSTDFNAFTNNNLINKDPLKSQKGIPAKSKVLTYIGSLGTWYMVEEMVGFYKLLHQQDDDWFFVILTPDPEEMILKITAAKNIPRESLLIRSVHRHEVPDWLAVTDWGISFIKPGYSKSASSPTKWAEFLASGVPIIVNKGIGDLDTLSRSIPGFLVCNEVSENGFQDAIQKLGDPTFQDREAIRNKAIHVFGLDQAIQKYYSVYRDVLKQRILFIASHRPGRAPNQRFRHEHYFPWLEEKGYQCHVSYLIGEKTDRYLYRPGNWMKKAWFFYFRCWVIRRKLLRYKNYYQVTVIIREALMTRSTFFERQLRKGTSRLVFDFDDSIWLSNVSEANRIFALMKNPGKTPRLIGLCDRVIAGNDYLADYARLYNPKVCVIPTTLDTDRFKPRAFRKGPGQPVVIGWTGSITTVPHLSIIDEALRTLMMKYGNSIIIKVIGDEHYQHKDLPIKGEKWSLESEVSTLEQFDIGIMPLPDNEWTKGKCGFKGILCMSMGIPVVMSPVGVNREIVEDGIYGYLAGSQEEWIEKLSRLIESETLRNELGNKARETVIRRYSMHVWKDAYLQCLISTGHEPA